MSIVEEVVEAIAKILPPPPPSTTDIVDAIKSNLIASPADTDDALKKSEPQNQLPGKLPSPWALFMDMKQKVQDMPQQVANFTVGAVSSSIDAGLQKASNIAVDLVGQTVKAVIDHGVGVLREIFGGVGGKPASPTFKPVEPTDVLKKLSEALAAAEDTLNNQKLIIAGGTVDVELFTRAGDDEQAGSRTRITLNITPQS